MRTASALLIALCLGGCATMASIQQQVTITSDPSGADVNIGSIAGVTPMSATLPSGYAIPGSFQVSKAGYQPQALGVQKGFRTSALIQDIFPGFLLGPLPLLVDAITGDWWYVANTSYHIRLHPVAGFGSIEKAPASDANTRMLIERK
jgi:hypothetical protein